ncbi:MAG: PAS domain-containing protein, partial [Opitutales bacterium]
MPTLFLDPDLCIQRYTPAAERLLHMGPRDLERPITELDRELLNEALPEQCRSVLDDFQPVRREIRDPGRRRWYLRQITPYRTDDRHIEGVVILFQDITELKALTDRAKSRERQQAAVAKLGLLALRSADLEELMHQAVRQVARTLNADYCKVLQHHPEQHLLRMVAGVGWREGLVGKATVPDDQDSQAGYTLLSREPVITQLAEEKRFDSPALLTKHDVASGMSCVINHSQPAYGVIGVHCRDVREFTVDDANFLQSVANMLSTALQQRTHQSALHESENRFRTMANSIPQLAWMTDETGYIFWYNQRWYDYTGTTLEDMQGWGWQKIHHPNHIERVVRIIKHSFDTGEAWEDTFPLRGKDGQYRWFLSRALPIRDEHGKIVRWFGTNTDITENLEKEAALRASERKLRLAKDAARLGLFDYDIPNESISWDPLLHEIWGVDLETPVTYDLALGGLHPDDRAPAEAAVLRALAPSGDGLYNITYRVINARTGKVSSVNASGTTEFVDGKPVRMVGLVNDVTEIYEAREAIARSEYRLRLAKESARLGMFDYDIVNNRIEWDPLLREIWGIAPDETVTFETFSRGLPPEDLAHTQAAIDRSFDPEGDRHFEATYRVVNAKTQELFWVHASGQVEFEQGRAVRMIGLVNDITHQENTRTQLANSEHRLRLAKDAARLAVFDFDMVNDRVEWDERMGEIWGIPRTNHITLADAFGSIHPDDHEKVRAEVERSCNPDGDGYYACTYRVINQRSERLHWISAFGVVHFKDRQPVRMIGLIDDVTDQEEIKQQLRAAITELQDTDRKKNDFLSILGHELRNPLAALSGCVQVLAEEVPEQGELLSIMHHSTRTMARLLDDLLDLKRVSSSTIELELEPLDLSELLNDISRIMRDRLTERKHRFEVVIEPGLTVHGDAVRLEQVFTNLLVNAAKYTPEGGDVILRAHREGDKVFVEVEDTGMGFAKGMASKLFDPFYQVKPDNQAASGLGIGLALSRKLVDLHGGTISTYSPGPGQGATFTVRLPLGKPAQNDTPQEPAQTAVANELKVLLVEDHESIRRMMPIQLQALGCQVETAANGEEGLSKAAEFQPDAVVLDIGLPDITGHEVGRRLRQRGYRGRLIALS